MATRHSMMKPTMKDTRSDVMFCRMTDIRSAIADFTSAASVLSRAATRLELFSSSSNHPTSFLKMTAHNGYYRWCLRSNNASSLSAEIMEKNTSSRNKPVNSVTIPASIILRTLVVRFSPMMLKK